MTPPDFDAFQVARMLGFPPDVEAHAAEVLDAYFHTEQLAGGDTNAVAISRLLDCEDERARILHAAAGAAAQSALEARRLASGRLNPATTRRDAEAIAEGLVAGVTAAVAAMRMARREGGA